MTQRLFFAMRRQHGTLTPMLFHDEFAPSRDERETLVYACELPEIWHRIPLDALAGEYRKLDASGKLPASILKGR